MTVQLSLFTRHPELIRADWVKEGAVVIDVGINVAQSNPQVSSSSASTQQAEAAGREASCSAEDTWPAFSPGSYNVVGDVAFEDVSRVRQCFGQAGGEMAINGIFIYTPPFPGGVTDHARPRRSGADDNSSRPAQHAGGSPEQCS